MRIAALVKQVPRFEELALGPDGRLQRAGLDAEMNPYCRRAVAQAVALAEEHGGDVTVITLGPPGAQDVLREGIAWAQAHGVEASGMLVTDPAFAGSDTLATARALARTIERYGPFDLVIAGRNSVDADTGQVGPEVAELLDLPFVTGVRRIMLDGGTLFVRLEHDDGWVQAEVALPAVISVAERLVEPAKVDREGRAAVDGARLTTVGAAALGVGPWGQAGSPTRVGDVRLLPVSRRGRRRPDAPLPEQVAEAVEVLADLGAFAAVVPGDEPPGRDPCPEPDSRPADGPPVAVLVEPTRPRAARELLGEAARLADTVGGYVVALSAPPGFAPAELGAWGADLVVVFDGAQAVEEDAAAGAATWARRARPWAILAAGTAWGREVASRVAARLDAGLVGDAVELAARDGRLVAWKPAFGGSLVAAVTAESDIQLATVRPGVLPLRPERGRNPAVETETVGSRRRVVIRARDRDDDLDVLTDARVIVGVGSAVGPDEYPLLQSLLDRLGAPLGATRKVTDRGWLPRARQIGLTGRSVAPGLYVAIAIQGKFNHMVGVRGAGAVLAVNSDRGAPVFDAADAGIVGDWHAAVPLLTAALPALGPTARLDRQAGVGA